MATCDVMDVVGVAMPPAAEFVLEFNYAHLPSITPLSPPFTPLSPPFPHHHTIKWWKWTLGSLCFFDKQIGRHHGLHLQHLVSHHQGIYSKEPWLHTNYVGPLDIRRPASDWPVQRREPITSLSYCGKPIISQATNFEGTHIIRIES